MPPRRRVDARVPALAAGTEFVALGYLPVIDIGRSLHPARGPAPARRMTDLYRGNS
ncbi:hypothetical protein KL86PLE_90554 [uncultured Pleomorphomonas sp.]|uniref:Uncharacterized protein n=1 Tax=uncultured Pleomorphomonas sp. TaxID=442121 RepID=A0A212LQB7_9HYPH|nr:hypothetical protein KL86PLE_90554 [uncultured Pleomorphomonas sp.]